MENAKELCVHSCRYYFRTQLSALRVDPDYVEYWFGPKNKVHVDVKSNDEEFHGSLYRKAGFGITPRLQASRLDTLKQLVTTFGYILEES